MCSSMLPATSIIPGVAGGVGEWRAMAGYLKSNGQWTARNILWRKEYQLNEKYREELVYLKISNINLKMK